jgi:hypothetical protein
MGGLSGGGALILTTFFFPSVLYFVYTSCRSLAMSAVNQKNYYLQSPCHELVIPCAFEVVRQRNLVQFAKMRQSR